MKPRDRDNAQSKDNEWLSSTAAAAIIIYVHIQGKSIELKAIV